MKQRSTRAERMARQFDPRLLDEYGESHGVWFESEEEVEAALDWGRRKAGLLCWVRRHMARSLTPRERRCIELHYFEDLPYARVGEREKCSASSAHRAVARALHKLRCAAETDPSWRAFARPGRGPRPR